MTVRINPIQTHIPSLQKYAIIATQRAFCAAFEKKNLTYKRISHD